MERFVKGDVVVLPFPFSDLSSYKRRPALVVADLIGDDVVLCQITGENRVDTYSIDLLGIDFERGSLKKKSTIRPNVLFTANNSIIKYRVGSLNDKKVKDVEDKIIKIVKNIR